MNDASPRFAEGQTGAASLLSSEEGNLRLAELAQPAVELNAWVTEEGLRGATAGELFDGYCQRLSAMDVVIMRAYVSTQTLHPQWTGYGYTWRRELRSVREQQFARGPISQEWLSSPFNALIQRSLAGEKEILGCRRLGWNSAQSKRDFPRAQQTSMPPERTDYVCLAFRFGEAGDPSHGTGVVFILSRLIALGAFVRRRLICCVLTLPGLVARDEGFHTGHDIASGLLRTYLGSDAGSRVHSGAVERGTVDGLRSVLWYADLRGFTRISDVSSGGAIVDMLNDTFETLTAALRPAREVMWSKFIGDAMLATISFDEPDERGNLPPRPRCRC